MVSGPTPLLLTGFNRRFSAHAEAVAAVTRGRAEPLTMTYRVNAGALPPDHWANGPEGGGRNRGEACHFYDFFTFLTGARVRSVSAVAAGGKILHPSENFTASIGFDDGSIASLTYTAAGTSEVPKERVEIFVDGKVMEIDDFRSLRTAGIKLAAALSSRLPPGGSILDFGCGSGEIARHLGGQGWRVTACDITPEMIAAARARDEAGRVRWLLLEHGALP